MEISPRSRALHLFGLTALAVAQPLFELLARQSTFLVAHRVGPSEVLGLVVSLILGLPAAIALVGEVLRRLRPTLGDAYQRGWVGMLVGLLWLSMAQKLLGADSAWLSLSLAVVLAGLVIYLYPRREGLRLFLSVLAIATVLVPAGFLSQPSIRGMAFGTATSQDTVSQDTVSQVAGTPSGSEAQPQLPPVVFIVFDEFPLASLIDGQGQILEGRYPSFARLAEQSHWFRNATAIADDTQYALPPILAGIHPRGSKLPSAADYPNNLFTLLGPSHRIAAEEVISQLCPTDLCPQNTTQEAHRESVRGLAGDLWVIYQRIVLPEPVADGLGVPAITSAWRDFGEPALRESDLWKVELPPTRVATGLAQFLESLEQPHNPDRPGLYFLHSLLPHMPWIYTPSGRQYAPMTREHPEGTVDEVWSLDPWLTRLGQQQHLIQLAYTDRVLGEILDQLEQGELFNRSLIVVTADHGSAFRHGDSRRRLSPKNYFEILSIPLFIKEPGQTEGQIHDQNVELIDILPTLAGRLGLRSSWTFDGSDVLSEDFEPRPRKLAIDPGNERAFPLEPMMTPKLFEVAQGNVELFGRDLSDLYFPGLYPELKGVSIEDLESIDLEIEADQLWRYQDVPAAGFLPARLRGHLPLEISPEILAVAVDGTIRATTQSLRLDGKHIFSAMLPDSALSPGPHDIEIVVIREEDEGSPQLYLAALAQPEAYRLEGDRLIDPSGQTRSLTHDSMIGTVWSNDLGLEGWAADRRAGQSAQRVLVFDGPNMVASTRVELGTPQLDHENLKFSGFRLPLPNIEPDDRARLRVIAVSEQHAGVLSWAEAP